MLLLIVFVKKIPLSYLCPNQIVCCACNQTTVVGWFSRHNTICQGQIIITEISYNNHCSLVTKTFVCWPLCAFILDDVGFDCGFSLFVFQIPNPLFDLAGITCGHFLVPFWTFFGATVIGKAIIKMHIQVSHLC